MLIFKQLRYELNSSARKKKRTGSGRTNRLLSFHYNLSNNNLKWKFVARAKFNDNSFRHSSHIKVITSTI
jgi:hypothetical protein